MPPISIYLDILDFPQTLSIFVHEYKDYLNNKNSWNLKISAGWKLVPPQLYFEFRAIFLHWLAQQYLKKNGENFLKAGFYHAKTLNPLSNHRLGLISFSFLGKEIRIYIWAWYIWIVLLRLWDWNTMKYLRYLTFLHLTQCSWEL